ncbi:hypothetical protein F0562_014695 [Nyssa sinensis]|uniref:Uncharacterized protein n=1 Tax=Nyssa sinensis TaxID=561372 RepID=A0A5J4ZQY7_9ASTE|nr:hypothetical protein F0562_014695 [Nyssa sinensis]
MTLAIAINFSPVSRHLEFSPQFTVPKPQREREGIRARALAEQKPSPPSSIETLDPDLSARIRVFYWLFHCKNSL